METKYCKRCKEEKSIQAFSRNRCRKDGLQDYCKECNKALLLQWTEKNPDRLAQNLAKWAKNNPDKRKYYLKNYRRTGIVKARELRRKAKERGNSFDLTIEEFANWFDSQEKCCHYCGCEVFEYSDLPQGKKQLLGLTIDRKDNDKSYSVDNIAIACRRCNLMKGSWLNEEQMLDAAKRYFVADNKGG